MAEPALARVVNRLGSRRVHVLIIGLATLLGTSSLAGGRTLDDWVIAAVARGEGAPLGLSSQRWDCFNFTTGEPLRNAAMISRGVLLPWWSEPELKLAFFRPLAAVTHVLDELVWPSRPWLLHAHSLLWFSLLLVAVGALYRRFSEDSQLSNLAFALYAWDDARGATLSWLANRNALISGAFGCACLAAHDVWRRGGDRRYGVLALACFTLSGLAGELAVGVLAYLLAYAAFLDPAPLLARFRALVGYAALAIVWRVGWSAGGYGAHGSGAYVDPLADPLGFLSGAPRKWLCLLQGQLGIVPADFAFLGQSGDQRLWTISAVVTVAAAASLLGPTIDDARGRFWLCGSLLSLLPMAASFPSDRLLLFVGLGFAPLFARAFLRAVRGVGSSASGRRPLLRRGLVFLFIAVHGVLAPLLLPVRAGQMNRMARAEGDAIRELRALVGDSRAPLLILNAPSVVLASYAQVRAQVEQVAPLSSIAVLSATDSTVELTRSGPREITLRAEHGFLHSPLERHYRAAPSSLLEQGRVSLPGFSVRVTEASSDGRPSLVRLTLDKQASEYVFACWIAGRFRRCQLPETGRSLRLPAEDLAKVLFGTSAGPAT